MKRIIEYKGIIFEIGNRTPRRNEYEKGCKYFLIVEGIPTSCIFSTIREAKNFIENNYFIFK